MWDYLKSIGFEDIPNNDARLGRQTGWKNNIAKGNLCAYDSDLFWGDFIFLIDRTNPKCYSASKTSTDADLGIYSVADLETWLRVEYPEFFTVEKESPKQKLTIEEVHQAIKQSAFAKQGYTVNVPLHYLKSSLAEYTAQRNQDEAVPINSDTLQTVVPYFQRKCTHWTESMQASFVENIIKGCHTEILLFNIGEEECLAGFGNRVLDGQHRLMALLKFLDNKLPIFGGNLLSDLENEPIMWRGMSKIAFTVFNFDTEEDAIQFYIEMNENITHSPEDIQKARTILNNLKGEQN